MLDELRKLSQHLLEAKNQKYRRYFIKKTSLNQRLLIITGQRGIGKTTIVIQHLLDYVKGDYFNPQILYIQADHFLLRKHSLYEIAAAFDEFGGRLLAIDEIHKYANWSNELKSIYDTFPNLKILASGSSALEIYKGTHDLSRRAVLYKLCGLSFREYLELYYDLEFASYTFLEILVNHERISADITKKIAKTNKKILSHFKDYLNYGYYPYYREINDKTLYHLMVEQNLHTTIESDLVMIYPHLTGSSVKKIKQLLSYIASSVPFTPNWQKIRSIVEIGDERTVKNYFKYLEDADLIQTISRVTEKLSKLETPEKIYLNNSNQMYALSYNHINSGTIRETFFLNMLSLLHDVTFPQKGDFLIDNEYLFEIGGRKKGFDQIKEMKHVYLAIDEMEKGIGKKIPLWLFGFLY